MSAKFEFTRIPGSGPPNKETLEYLGQKLADMNVELEAKLGGHIDLTLVVSTCQHSKFQADICLSTTDDYSPALAALARSVARRQAAIDAGIENEPDCGKPH